MVEIISVSPGKGYLAVLGQIWAIIRAELVMQWRRWGLWLAYAFATLIIIVIFIGNAGTMKHLPPQSMFVRLHFTSADFANLFLSLVTTYADLIFGIISALLVADRLLRDRRLGVFDLQRSTPQNYAIYVAGKFMGNYLAVLVPSFIGYVICVIGVISVGLSTGFLLLWLQAFFLVIMPALAVVVALSLLFSSVLPVRIVQVGFPLLWLYTNESPFGWRTLDNTIFNPNGKYIFPVFFPTPVTRLYAFETSLQLAVLNISLLLATFLVAIVFLMVSLCIQTYYESIA